MKEWEAKIILKMCRVCCDERIVKTCFEGKGVSKPIDCQGEYLSIMKDEIKISVEEVNRHNPYSKQEVLNKRNIK